MVILVLPLTACTGTLDLFGGNKVDTSVYTGSIATTRDTTAISDDMTVRNAVSSADLSKSAGMPLPWANASTGSAGVIDQLQERHVSGTICRNFRTTRHSYEGIARFSGETCLGPGGEWVLTRYTQQ